MTEKAIPRITPPYPFEAYTHVISPIPAEDGGGFMFTIPDIPGCLSDGATEKDALENGQDAFLSVVSALHDMGRSIPAPVLLADDLAVTGASGRFVTRVPKSIHARLAARAKAEGVSLNALVLSLLSEGLGRKADCA